VSACGGAGGRRRWCVGPRGRGGRGAGGGVGSAEEALGAGGGASFVAVGVRNRPALRQANGFFFLFLPLDLFFSSLFRKIFFFVSLEKFFFFFLFSRHEKKRKRNKFLDATFSKLFFLAVLLSRLERWRRRGCWRPV